MLFVLSRTWDKENILSSHEVSDLRPLAKSEAESEGLKFNSSWELVPCFRQDEKHLSLGTL